MMKITSLICLSTYRTALMGFAILWVMFYHLASQGKTFDFGPLNAVLCIGDSGVDVFMLLSGLGLYFSYDKQKSIAVFCKKRFIRILPTYLVVNVIVGLILNWPLETIAINISTIGYWFNKGCFEWYVPTILLFYMLFPLCYKFTNKYGLSFVVVNFCLVFGILLCMHFNDSLNFHDNRSFSLSRWPIFLLGSYIGRCIKLYQVSVNNFANLRLSLGGVSFLLAFLVLNMIYSFPLYSGVRQILHLFYIPGICMCVGIIINASKKVNAFLSFLGGLSLEIYLVHFYIMIVKPMYNPDFSIFCGIMYIIVSILLSWILNRLMESGMSFMKIKMN